MLKRCNRVDLLVLAGLGFVAANTFDAIFSGMDRLPDSDADVDVEPFVNGCSDPFVSVGEPGHVSVTPEMCSARNWTLWIGKRRRVFDVFFVDREMDLVEARLAELDADVDFFVVGEASKKISNFKNSKNSETF